MSKRNTAIGFIKLTRYQEFLLFVCANTFLGFIFSYSPLTTDSFIKLVIVLLANGLGVGFSFMINDVEDAADDALNPDKVNRNPISAGIISHKVGMVSSLVVAVVAILAFLPLGILPFLLGTFTVILGFLYSWKGLRLKSIPVVDLFSHAFMLAGLQYLCSYYTFADYTGVTRPLLLPLLLVSSISMYGELYNEVRDFTYDKLAGLQHTASLIGKRNAHILMYLLLSVGGGSILYMVYLHFIPVWFMVLFLVLGGLFFINFVTAFFTNTQYQMDDVQHYILLVSTIALGCWIALRPLGL